VQFGLVSAKNVFKSKQHSFACSLHNACSILALYGYSGRYAVACFSPLKARNL